MLVYHGTENEFEEFLSGTIFFSTDRDFASGYAGPSGTVRAFEIDAEMLLDTRDPKSLGRLTGGIPIEDPYSGQEYDTAEEFLGECAGDTWEAVEPLIESARAMGYVGMLITEGGILNVAVFDISIVREIDEADLEASPSADLG